MNEKVVRSRAGRSSPRPSISIRVRPIEMSKWPASSKTVQCGRAGTTRNRRGDEARPVRQPRINRTQPRGRGPLGPGRAAEGRLDPGQLVGKRVDGGLV